MWAWQGWLHHGVLVTYHCPHKSCSQKLELQLLRILGGDLVILLEQKRMEGCEDVLRGPLLLVPMGGYHGAIVHHLQF